MITDMQQNFHRSPQRVGDFFPGIIQIQWTMGNLTILTKEDLSQFHFLRSLMVMGQKLTTLGANLLENHPDMAEINFTSNQLFYIGAGLIANLRSLVTADFMANRCTGSFGRTNADMPRSTLLFTAHWQTKPLIT